MLQTIGKDSSWRKLLHFMAGTVIAMALFGLGNAHAKDLRLKPDEVRIMNMASEPAAVVVGNPVYADASVVANKRLMIQGRNPGKTSITVLDEDGNRLAQFNVVVNGTDKDAMVVFKANSRTTYVCAPDCSETLSADDYQASGENNQKPQYAQRVLNRNGAIKNFVAGN